MPRDIRKCLTDLIEYDDDTSLIPRSTTVVAKRLPAAKTGRGGAARYVSGKMPQSAKNSHRQELLATNTTASASAKSFTVMNGAQTEDEKIAAMFKMGADDWAQQQQQMAKSVVTHMHSSITLLVCPCADTIPNSAAPVFRGGPTKGRSQNLPDHPPPPGYICYRCGEKGHWIMECPTNNDPTFDGRPRIKRTTGIPKSFLKTIERPNTLISDGTVEEIKQPTGVMVNSEGDWVVAEPDQAAWNKYRAQAKISAAAQDAAAQDSKELQGQGLECEIDKRLFVNPTKTPCCLTTFCHECILNALLDNDLRCPQCSTENVPVDDLIPDIEMATKVREYEKRNAAVGAPAKENCVISIEMERDATLKLNTRSPSKSPAVKSINTAGAQKEYGVSSKKRPAQSDIENNHKPRGPSESCPQSGSGACSPEDIRDQTSRSDKPGRQIFPTHGSYINRSAFNAMVIPNRSGFMGMGMPTSMTPPIGMNTAMQNHMMVQNAQFAGNEWCNMWGMGFPQQHANTGGGFQKGATYNSSFNQQTTQNQGANNYLNGVSGDVMGASSPFANQQRSHNEEESAYFRKPVNPNRQQNRRNWNQNRPADYREI